MKSFKRLLLRGKDSNRPDDRDEEVISRTLPGVSIQDRTHL
jgi:hypothetical protein